MESGVRSCDGSKDSRRHRGVTGRARVPGASGSDRPRKRNARPSSPPLSRGRMLKQARLARQRPLVPLEQLEGRMSSDVTRTISFGRVGTRSAASTLERNGCRCGAFSARSGLNTPRRRDCRPIRHGRLPRSYTVQRTKCWPTGGFTALIGLGGYADYSISATRSLAIVQAAETDPT